MAMENGSFIGDFPIEMSMNEGFSYGFSIAMFDDRRVVNVIEPHWTPKWLVASRLRMAFNFPGEQVGHFPQAIDPIEAWNMGIISASFFFEQKEQKKQRKISKSTSKETKTNPTETYWAGLWKETIHMRASKASTKVSNVSCPFLLQNMIISAVQLTAMNIRFT